MRLIVFLLLISLLNNAFSQSIIFEKIKELKSSTVQILCDSSAGTGFYIDKKGTIATCLHVVLNALKYNKPIFARDNNDLLFELRAPQLTDSGIVYAHAYDLFILIPQKPLPKATTFLKLGDFSKLQEGQEVFTCGYPFGDLTQFVSKGIVSTKIIRPSMVSFPGISITELRQELLLDLTSNHGNSGGALIKSNPLSKDDEVVGIIDYAVTPLGQKLDSITTVITQSSWAGVSFGTSTDANGKTISGGYNPVTTSLLFAKFFSTITYGVNGAVSVNHLSQLLKEIK